MTRAEVRVVFLVAGLILAGLTGLPRVVGTASGSGTLFQVGKTYKVNAVGTQQGSITVLEIGADPWIKVKSDNKTLWMNSHLFYVVIEE
jgi:hypothetical protein